MENPQKRRVDMLLYVVGPLTPQQAPLILDAAVQVLNELPERWNGRVCGADVEGRLIELFEYCKEHDIPHVNCDIFGRTDAIYYKNMMPPLEGPLGTLAPLDRRTFPPEFVICGTDVLFLFYAPGEDTLREVALLQDACEAAGGYCFLCPV